jgi:hypothetical protein
VIAGGYEHKTYHSLPSVQSKICALRANCDIFMFVPSGSHNTGTKPPYEYETLKLQTKKRYRLQISTTSLSSQRPFLNVGSTSQTGGMH